MCVGYEYTDGVSLYLKQKSIAGHDDKSVPLRQVGLPHQLSGVIMPLYKTHTHKCKERVHAGVFFLYEKSVTVDCYPTRETRLPPSTESSEDTVSCNRGVKDARCLTQEITRGVFYQQLKLHKKLKHAI